MHISFLFKTFIQKFHCLHL